jgi:hypothetical protein
MVNEFDCDAGNSSDGKLEECEEQWSNPGYLYPANQFGFEWW